MPTKKSPRLRERETMARKRRNPTKKELSLELRSERARAARAVTDSNRASEELSRAHSNLLFSRVTLRSIAHQLRELATRAEEAAEVGGSLSARELKQLLRREQLRQKARGLQPA
jgi:hypothetical protein